METALNYDWDEGIKKGLRYLEKRKPHISEDVISFTDVVAGKKSRDGGEYGFWTTFTPIPEYPGLYEVETHTTCEISDCGTGYIGIYPLTEEEYREFRSASDRIEREGFRQQKTRKAPVYWKNGGNENEENHQKQGV